MRVAKGGSCAAATVKIDGAARSLGALRYRQINTEKAGNQKAAWQVRLVLETLREGDQLIDRRLADLDMLTDDE